MQEPFSWSRQWYPLAFVEYLDPKVRFYLPSPLASPTQSRGAFKTMWL